MVLLPEFAEARQSCQSGLQAKVCTSEVALTDIVYAAQRMSQWCWAASASMVFSVYGYSVPQEQIVEAVFGRLVNLPAFNTQILSQLLSRRWTDVHGRQFECRIAGLYDAYTGVGAIDNWTIVSALTAGKPLFYCNTSHAMVLTAVVYQTSPMGMMLINAGFVDPYPGIGPRGASPAEMYPVPAGGAMTYLALPEVRRV